MHRAACHFLQLVFVAMSFALVQLHHARKLLGWQASLKEKLFIQLTRFTDVAEVQEYYL